LGGGRKGIMINNIKGILVLFVLSVTCVAKAQTTSTICDSLDKYWDKLYSKNDSAIGIVYMTSAPELLESWDSLTVHLEGADTLFKDVKQLKVYVSFYVNNDGNPICIKSIKSPDISLNYIAEKKVKTLKFRPAKLNNEIIIVRMTLPIIFVKEG
jgi:hypothetical protein